MPRQNNAAYWAQRMKRMEDALKDQTYAYVENMERQFAAAQAEVQRQLGAWYQRFADNNGLTLADARRLLNTAELEEFRWTVEEYIRHGEENALSGAWMRQLENASARVHISYLEAVQLQLQQQAEVLYGNQLDVVDTVIRGIYLGSYYGTAFELQRGLGVGRTMHVIDERTIEKVLSRPWTVDGATFRDRCWTNKQALVNSVNTNLTQMIIRGEAPDRAIQAIAHQFGVAKDKAGRLVMTEAAAFSSAAQKDCYRDLEVEQYKVVATFDGETCSLCGDLDGKVFQMSDYKVGLTAPPFHPWCRCCTCPYFADMVGIGERWARNADGTATKVPADMSFGEWRERFAKGINTGLTPPRQNAIMAPMNGQDVTREYLRAATPNSHPVRDLHAYVVDGITYTVDGRNVVLDYSPHEKEIAELLERKLGGEIFMVPRVNDPPGVSTPDYLLDGERFDLKSPKGGGKNTLYDIVAKKAAQADNFVFDLTNCPLHDEEVDRQLAIIYKSTHTKFVKTIIVMRNGEIVRILRRNK